MKLFGILLLSGYFLVREREMSLDEEKSPAFIFYNTLVYLACAVLAAAAGLIFSSCAALNHRAIWQPMAMLSVAALATFFFKRNPHFMMSSAFTAFWILYSAKSIAHFLIGALCAGFVVFILQFLYLGMRERILRLHVPAAIRKGPARLIVLFALTLLFAFVYEKAVQLF